MLSISTLVPGGAVTAKWQSTLEHVWPHKQLVILCGSVRDEYLCQMSGCKPELTDVEGFLARWVRRRVRNLVFYDPMSKFRRELDETLRESLPHPADTTSGDSEVDGAKPDAPKFGRGKSVPGIRQDITTISDEQSVPETCHVVNFAERVAPAGASDPEDRDSLILLEKLLLEMPEGNHLVLIYLMPEQVPRELYVNQPKSVVIEISRPDRKELRQAFKSCFHYPEQDVDRAVNVCHGMTLTEVKSLVESVGDSRDVGALERAARVYRFGEETNYWDELDLDKLKRAAEFFIDEEGIKGQDAAIRKVQTVLVRARADIRRTTGGNPGQPRGVLFFAGPTGVGKTLTARTLAKFLFGDDQAFLRFDMSEYGQEQQVSRLYGAPPGYVGFEQGGTLTGPIETNPFRVVLFDEIDKADTGIFDVFLQILGDGRLTDSKGQVALFSDSFIIFTSNLGAHNAESTARLQVAISQGPAAVHEHFRVCVEDFFRFKIGRPELLNRIGRDNIVVFDFVDAQTTGLEILRYQLGKIVAGFNAHYGATSPRLKLEMDVDEAAAFFLDGEGERIDEFGGREVENLVNVRVRDSLADCVLQAESGGPADRVIRGGVDGDIFRMRLV